LIANPGTLITMISECFPKGEVALDITEGKLFLLFDYAGEYRAAVDL
jgi:hypothetical protein